MTKRSVRNLAPILFLFAVAAGCNQAPPPPKGTGAAEAAQEYYLAFLSEDWPKAYAVLDPASHQNLPELEFNRPSKSRRFRP